MGHYPNSVTNKQLYYIIFLTLTSYATIDLPSVMAQASGRISWIPIILTSIVFGIATYMLCQLNTMHEGKVFFDYGQELVGKYFTYSISIYYIIYLFYIGTILQLKLVNLLSSNFLPLTPPIAVLIIGITVFGYIANKGITNLARLMELIGITFIIVTVVLCILMIAEGMHYNILPILNPLEIKYVAPAMKDAFFSFGGISVLLIIPFTNLNKNAPKNAFKTLVIIGLFYVLIVESTIMILGLNNSILLNDSFIEAIKIIEIPVIERTDIFYLIFGLTSLFTGIIIVYIIILELSCKIFPNIKRYIVTIIISVLLFILSSIAINAVRLDLIFDIINPIIIGISSLLIPTTLFITAKIKAKLAKNHVTGE